MDLNSREVALLLWLAIGLVLGLAHPKIRPGAIEVARAFAHPKILTPIGLLYAYLGFVVWGLHAVGLWDWDQLKNTIVWSLVVGIASFFNLNKLEDRPHYLREWLRDLFTVLVVVEFLANFYTFPLLAELLLFPVIFLIVGMVAVGQNNPKVQPAVRFLNGVMGLLGLSFLAYAVYMAVANFGEFAGLATLRDFYTPILLSLLFIPFIFVLHTYAVYETTFLALSWSIKDEGLRRYAKLIAALAFGPRVHLLRRWQYYLGAHRPDDKHDIWRAIKAVKDNARRERKPIPVSPERGWSPHLAASFLAEFDLVPGDYHRSFDVWAGSSPMRELGDGIMPDNLAYYIEGDELVATRLKLKLNVNNPADPTQSETRFREAGRALLKAAIGLDHFSMIEPFEWSSDTHRARLDKVAWSGGIQGGYEWTLLTETTDQVGAEDAAKAAAGSREELTTGVATVTFSPCGRRSPKGG